MTALEASSVRVRTMADGTLRAELDFEPRHAAAAFKLLGSPGQPVAVAGIKTKAQQQADRPKGGAWAQWLGVRCGEPAFQAWLRESFRDHAMAVALDMPDAAPAAAAAEVVRRVCSVQSRVEIDNDTDANERFQARIRGPWALYYQGVQG